MIVSQASGATQTTATSGTAAAITLNAGNRAAPYLLICNVASTVAFVCVSVDATTATTSHLPIMPNSSIVVGNPKPGAAGTNITVSTILASGTGVVYVTGVDVVGT